MPAQIIDGKALAARLRAELAPRIAALRTRGVQPGLAVILVGDDPASAVYVRNKVKACEDTGIAVIQRGVIRESGFVVNYAYLDTVERAGIVIELIQWRLGPLPVPINQRVHKVVSTLGSRTLFRGRVIK